MQILKITNPNNQEVLEVLLDDYAYQFLKDRKLDVYGDTSRRPYARVSIQGHWIPIHKLLGGDDFQIIDHINGNQLDNRIKNLRGATTWENGVSRRKPFYKNKVVTSKYKGVHKKTLKRNWYASITSRGEHYHLGSFKNEEEAAKAYDKKAKELFGEYAKLNF